LRRDANVCASCLDIFLDKELVVDHIIPLEVTKQECDDSGLQLLCKTCDAIKRAIEQARRTGAAEDAYLHHLFLKIPRVKSEAIPLSAELKARAARRLLEEEQEL
jgi:hypothetical protein